MVGSVLGEYDLLRVKKSSYVPTTWVIHVYTSIVIVLLTIGWDHVVTIQKQVPEILDQ